MVSPKLAKFFPLFDLQMTYFGSTLKIYENNIMSAIYFFLPATLYDSIFEINLSDTLPDFSARSLGILTY